MMDRRSQLKAFNMPINREKTSPFLKEVDLLGHHHLSHNRIRSTADRTQGIRDFPVPKTVCDVRQDEYTTLEEGELTTLLNFLEYNEDEETFAEWEGLLDGDVSWEAMPPSARIWALIKHGQTRDLDRFRAMRIRLVKLARELRKLEGDEADSEEVLWTTARRQLIEIFHSTNEEQWTIPPLKKSDSIYLWSLIVWGLYLDKKITWAHIVKDIESTVPHSNLAGKVFDPTKPDLRRFVDLCAAIDNKEKATRRSQAEANRKTGTSNPRLNLVCTYCKKKGHKEEECFTKKNKESKETKPKAKLTSLEPQMRTNIPLPEEDKVEIEGPCIAEFTLGSGKPMSGTYVTGSQLNVINWEMYEQLVQEQGPIQCYKPEITSLYSVNGKEVRTESLIVLPMSVKGVEVGRQQFYIIRNKRLDQPLIGLPAIRAYESRIDALKTKVQLDKYPIPEFLPSLMH
ncbi:hypothetical protein NEHOM01_1251 [Nematocida homosporus]|uniref:uncharacterized protein n=1 Tax=Nematocida homosporus TaxID=1912981 RepID=UPI00221F73A1|nr:uncharacterized protein NEHOM01_1251 [Nematocida homosporus]KAI5186048.1 hypothetical protein NEHOM01_1251 [Nematocida homosporus]